MSLNDINSLSHTKQESVLSGKESSDWEDIKTAVRVERSENYRGGGLSGPYPYAGGNPTEDCGFQFYGVSERYGL